MLATSTFLHVSVLSVVLWVFFYLPSEGSSQLTKTFLAKSLSVPFYGVMSSGVSLAGFFFFHPSPLTWCSGFVSCFYKTWYENLRISASISRILFAFFFFFSCVRNEVIKISAPGEGVDVCSVYYGCVWCKHARFQGEFYELRLVKFGPQSC